MAILNAFYSFPGRLSQLIAVVSGTLTALSDGMQYGWTSPISTILLSPSSPIPASQTTIIFLEVIYMIGGLFGIPATVYLLDKVGRKKTMLLAAAASLMAWMLTAFATSVITLYIARFIFGSTADVNFVTAPVYIAEISDKNIRGRLGSIIIAMTMTGVLLIYSVGPYVSITVSSMIGVSILATQLLTFSLMPDSPYYYLMKNQREEARKSLLVFRSTSNVDDELEEIEKLVKTENEKSGKVLDLFRIKSNLKSVLILSVLNIAEHFSGVSVLFMNMHMILEDTDSLISTNAAAIIFSVVMLIALGLTVCIIDQIGRKILLCVSCFLTAVVLLIFAVYFTIKNSGVAVSHYSWVPLVALVLYAFTYKLGLGTVPIVLTAEIFPTNVKKYGVTYGDAVYIVAGTASIFVFYLLKTTFGIEVPFYMFSACCLLTCLFSIFFVPETRGKTLDEIQILLKKGAISNSTDNNINLNEYSKKLPINNIVSNSVKYGTRT